MASALTRIKNNQIYASTIVASAKLVNQSVTGGLLSDPLNYSGNMTITGNLTVNGTTTIVDTTNTYIADPVIVLSRGTTGAPTNDSGFLVKRGTSNNAAFVWDETNGQFVAITTTSDGSTAGAITQTAFANLKVGNIIASGSTSNIANLSISDNTISSTNTNANINLIPNGLGDVVLSADTVTIGDANAVANLTTNGTGNLVLSTNNGTNSGNIIIAQGANGNISITPNGTGQVILANAAVSTLTSGRFTISTTNGTLTDSSNFTYSGSAMTMAGNLAMNGGVLTTTSTTANVFNANATTLNLGGAATTINMAAANATTNITGGISFGGALTRSAWGTAGVGLNQTASTYTDSSTAASTTVANNMVHSVQVPTLAASNLSVTYTTAATMYIANAPQAGANVTITNPYAIYVAAGNVNLGNVATMTTANVTTINATTVNANTFGSNGATTVLIANATATTLNIGGAATAVNIGAATGTTIVKNSLQVDGGNLTFGAATTANIANATVTTLNIGGAATTTNIGNSAGNVVVAGDIQVSGNDIRSSTGNAAISLNDIDVTIRGNLTVQGATTTVGSNDLTINDSIINLHTAANLAPLTSDDGRDLGIKIHYYKTSDKFAFVGWANDTQYLEYYVDGTETVGGTFSGTYGSFKGATYISTATTGTAPLTVTSTTQVANLNVAVAGSLINGTSNVTIPSSGGNVTISSAGNANVVIVTGTGANISNLSLVNNTLASTVTNANINLTPNGTGQVVIANAVVSTLTATRVTYAGTNGTLTDNANLTFSGTLLTVTGNANVSGTANIGNIQASANTISSVNLNGNINISPNGTGSVLLVANTVVHGTSNTATTLTTNGTGSMTLNTNSGTSSGSVVITAGANGNISLTPNGTGQVVIANAAVSTLTSGRVTYASSNGTLTDNTNLTFTGTLLTVTGNATVSGTANIGNIQASANTISSSNTNGNINIDPNGTGSVVVNSTGDNSDFYVNANLTTYASTPVLYTKASSGQVGIMTSAPSTGVTLHVNATDSMLIPKGTTGNRPTGIAGMMRFNTSLNILEFYDGTTWQSTQGSFTVINYQNFTGDGATLVYTLSTSSTTAATLVAINGVLQKPSDAYSVSGTSLTFTEAPISGDDIDVRLLTTTTTVTSLAEGDSAVTVTDPGTGNVIVKLDGTNVAYWTSSIYSQSTPSVAAVTGTSVGTTAVTIDQFPVASYRSAKYIIQVSNSGRGDYETQEVVVTHNGTTASRAAYGIVYTNVALGTSTVTISGGNVQLQFTGNYAGNTVKVAATYIPV